MPVDHGCVTEHRDVYNGAVRAHDHKKTHQLNSGATMGFVQIIKMVTSDFDGIEAAHEKWLAATEGERTVSRELVCQNRDQPGEYWVIVEFPSHEAADRNNDLAATAEISQTMGALSDGGMEFINLDVLRQD